MEGKPNILEGNQKFWKETKKFRRKPKSLEGSQKFWKENKIKFWKETKKLRMEMLTPLGHRIYLRWNEHDLIGYFGKLMTQL